MSLKKVIGSAITVLGAGALLSTCDRVVDPVARMLAGGAPEKPEKVQATRGPIHVGIALDASLSEIRMQIGTASEATADFIQNRDTLRQGDTIKFCEVGAQKPENYGTDDGLDVRCKTYTMNAQREDLLLNVQDTQAAYMTTHLIEPIREMVQDLKEPCVIALWTDGKEEATDLTPIDLNGCSLKVLIPDRKYQSNADVLCTWMQGSCEVVPATSGADLEKSLGSLADTLQAGAQAAADARAKTDHEAALAEYERRTREFQEKADMYKSIARWTVGGVTFGLMVLATAIATYVFRPRCRGFVHFRKPETDYVKVVNLARYDASTVDLAKGATWYPKRILKAHWNGTMTCDGRPVRTGWLFTESDKVYFADQKLKESRADDVEILNKILK